MQYYAIFMHSACVHVHAHVYTMRLGYTRLLRTQAAAAAVNRTKGVLSNQTKN